MKEKKKYCYEYPHPAVATDCVVFGYGTEGLQVLLVERGGEPFRGCWAFPGGFLEINEDAETGALRELQEETGLKTGSLEQFYTFTAVNRDPRERVISIAYFTLIPLEGCRVKGGDDARHAAWFPLDGLPPLAFDHAEILQVAMDRLREKIQLYPDSTGAWDMNVPASDLRYRHEDKK